MTDAMFQIPIANLKSNMLDVNGPKGKVVPCEELNLYIKFHDLSLKESYCVDLV